MTGDSRGPGATITQGAANSTGDAGGTTGDNSPAGSAPIETIGDLAAFLRAIRPVVHAMSDEDQDKVEDMLTAEVTHYVDRRVTLATKAAKAATAKAARRSTAKAAPANGGNGTPGK